MNVLKLDEGDNRNLEDPLVNDDNGDIERPPLKDGQERSDNSPLKNKGFLHRRFQKRRETMIYEKI